MSQEDSQYYGRQNGDLVNIIERVLRQAEESKSYQARLESRIIEDSAAYHRVRGHCIQLERVITRLNNSRGQHEASVKWANDACYAMVRDLELERAKNRDLETRLSELKPSVETLIHYLNSGNNSQHLEQIQHENERQRDLILCLQATLKVKEQSIRELRVGLEEASSGLFHYDQTTQRRSESSTCSSVDIVTGDYLPLKKEETAHQ